jgi:hypothetical protein
MAAQILALPGMAQGPCLGGCAHKNCSLTRGMAGTRCPECKLSIGYGRAFHGVDGELYHAVCYERKVIKDQYGISLPTRSGPATRPL